MNSMLYQIYYSHFIQPNWKEHNAQVLENRMDELQKRTASLFREFKPEQQEMVFDAMEKQIVSQLNELPEMFCLGFSLGTRLMIEVLTGE